MTNTPLLTINPDFPSLQPVVTAAPGFPNFPLPNLSELPISISDIVTVVQSQIDRIFDDPNVVIYLSGIATQVSSLFAELFG